MTYRIALSRLLSVFALLTPTISLAFFFASISQAAVYDFVQEGTGDVLGTLTTDSPTPFDHTNFTDFSFTAAGNAIFGLGVGTYTGTFDTSGGNSFIADGLTSLQGDSVNDTVSAIDSDAPLSDIAPPTSSNHQFELFADNAPMSDVLNYDYVVSNLDESITEFGSWQLVQPPTAIPEPTTAALSVIAAFSFVGLGRRRRNR